MNLLWVVQVLFFGMGAWYFFKNTRKRRGEGLKFEDNMVEMDRLQMMREEKLTEPLAEQTRPKKLEEIIGQEKAIKALRASLCGPNPQHILIYGPPGVGKTAAARLIVKPRQSARCAARNTASSAIISGDPRGDIPPLPATLMYVP